VPRDGEGERPVIGDGVGGVGRGMTNAREPEANLATPLKPAHSDCTPFAVAPRTVAVPSCVVS